MDATLELTHERIDDVPLLLGFLIKLRFPEILDQYLPPHPLHQGLSNGWLITIWIAYILSRADHHKSPVREWANGFHHTLEDLHRANHPRRRLHRRPPHPGTRPPQRPGTLAHPGGRALARASCEVYALPVERVRLDSTTSYGYHTITDDGLMQLGHSKDHRPDLPQFKLMAAAAEPTGQLVACDVHPGQSADDPLYLPLIERVRAILGRTGLL